MSDKSPFVRPFRVTIRSPDGAPQKIECEKPGCRWWLYSSGPDHDNLLILGEAWRQHFESGECPSAE